ncbi:MAG: GNAT family N-acetyltransferase [Planctomycetes bacterium]|nr:GNAT family N-acetyltransferase [Planctomycetota bacterium]
MRVLETERLILRRLHAGDAPFIVELLNDPAWLKHIGDRGVRTLDDARRYIENGPLEMYARLGFGLYLVEQKADGAAIGLCGILKRDSLEHADLGFALLPDYRGLGLAHEAAAGTMEYARETLGLARIVAITSQENDTSGKLLLKLGFRFERNVRLSEDAEELRLYASDP